MALQIVTWLVRYIAPRMQFRPHRLRLFVSYEVLSHRALPERCTSDCRHLTDGVLASPEQLGVLRVDFPALPGVGRVDACLSLVDWVV